MLGLLALALASSGDDGGHPKRIWHTNARGLVEVNGKIPLLSVADQHSFEQHVRQWAPTVAHALAELTAPSRVTAANVLGFIWAESRGNPRARSPVGAIGLMQVFSPEARDGHSDAQLVDGPTNIACGIRYLNRIARPGDELPELASKYNAGQDVHGVPHVSTKSPWGMREGAGYIDTVVAASNYAASLPLVPGGADRA